MWKGFNICKTTEMINKTDRKEATRSCRTIRKYQIDLNWYEATINFLHGIGYCTVELPVLFYVRIK